MAENRFLQNPLDPSQQDAPSLALPAAPRIDQPDVATAPRQSSRALRANGLMPPQDLQPKFEAAAAKNGVPVNVLAALAAQESSYNADAVGVPTQWGRAKGMLQYIDPTAKGMGINPFDAEQSIDAAAKQLRQRLDAGDTMEEAVMAHFGGDDRSKWGAKTRAYGQEVLGKAGAIGKGLLEQQPAAAQSEESAPSYDLKSIQSELDAKEAGRFKVLTPEEAAAIQAKGPATPTATPADAGPDGFLDATGKALKNVPQNMKNSAGGLIRSIGEGIDDQSLVVQAKQAGILDQMQGSGELVFKADSPGGKARPYLKDGKFADTAVLADYIRKNAASLLPSDEAAANMTGMQPGAVSKYGSDLSAEARKDMVEVNPDGPLAKYGSMIIGSTAEMLPALTASVLARSPQPMMAIMGGQVFGQSYDKAREKGMNAQEAGGYATAQAVAEAIPEALPLHFILKPGQQFFKGLLTAGAAESLQEGVTQAIQSGIDKGTLDPNMTWGQAVEQIRDAMIVGAGSGGLMRAGVHGVEKLTNRGASPAEQAQDQPAPQDRVEPTTDEQAAPEASQPAAKVAPAEPSGPLTRAAAQMDPAELAKLQQDVVDAAAQEQAGTEAAPESKPAGEPVTVRGSDGEMPGTLESYQEDGKGGWNARVLADDGNAYEFTQDDGVTLDRAATSPAEATNDAQTDTAQNGLPEGDATEVPGVPVRPAPAERVDLSTATVPELRAELKAVAAELRGDRSNAELKARRKEIEKAINGAVEAAIADPATAAKHVEPKAEKLSAEELAAVGVENQRGRDEQAKRAEDYQKWKADYDQRQSGAASAVDALEGEKINRAWSKFAPDSGSLNVPRADMPQIKAEHRGAMTNFLNARGIQHTQEEVPASSLKPTQEEFSPAKVKKALGFTGGDRAILVSSDGHILDGHHQWLAKVDGDQPVKVIRLDAPIKQLLDTVREFPSAGQSNGAVQSATDVKQNAVDVKETAKPVKETTESASDSPVSASEVAKTASPPTKALPQIKPDLSGLGDVPSSRKQAAKKAAWTKAYRDTVDLQEGDSFTPSGDIGYASGGKTYTIERIGVDGSVSVNAKNGSGTIISRAEMQRARTQGVDLRKVETKQAAEQAAPEVPAKPEVSKNVLVSDDRAAELRQRLKGKLSQLNSGIDPEIVAIGTELAVYHIERGARTFAAYAKAIAADLGTTVQALRPYLRSWYNGSRDMMEDGGHSIDGMDGAETVRAELAKMAAPTVEAPEPKVGTQESTSSAPTEDALQADATPVQQRATAQQPSEPAASREERALEPGVYTHDRHPEVTATVAKTEKGFSVEWAPDDVQEFKGVNAKSKAIAALVREGYMKPDEARNAPSSRSGVEQDRQDADPSESVDADPARDAAGQADRSARDAGESARAERDAGQRDKRVPDDGAVADRARGDQLVHQPDGQFRSEVGATRGSERTGSGRDSESGTAVEQERASAIVESAPTADTGDVAKRVEAQRKAANVKTKRGDKANIDQALPLLLPPQREDVLKAETRHAIGNGMLFTNGTGTGKTASGLGVAKRFIGEGKDNIVVVVPSDKIASDWVKFAGMMGIELKQLTDTRDNGGSGPVITSYANFGANETLAQRQWDLAMADESHYLSSNEAGESTEALEQFRALTGHHDGFYRHVRDANPKEWKSYREAMNASRDAEKDTGTTATQKAALEEAQAKAKKVWDAIEQPARKAWNERWAKQEGLPKSVFLSATPFPYVKNIDYAEGYLFHYTDPASLLKSEGQGGGYNVGDARQKFLMQHFGYRMRTNKLTAPEAGVDSELMEQNFNQWLKDSGSLSGRRLEVEHDYDRKFATVDDAVGQKIDEGLKFLREEGDGKYREAYDAVSKQFDYQRRQYLLEAIKARAAVPIIKDHMALGRKVVVFHDFNKGGGFDPFDASNIVDEKARAQAKEAFAARPDLFKLDLKGLSSPIDTLGAAFPDALFFNGTVPKRLRRENADAFNDDSGDKHLIVVQSDAGREGVSLHDTSGKHQRVEINLGMPGKPVAAIQIEGRIYRTGQASDAIFRYLTTGTAWEASAFASKIAERASTAENLALGTDARGLKQSFIDAYNGADVMTASLEDGKGGKAYDRNMATGAQLSGFQKAKTYYFAQQKNSRRRDQREGVDYFATPEPVGFKMAEWANINQGDKVLEPSAGHGAIARFFPVRTDVTMVEPSYELSQRAALANGAARIVNDRFEDLHLTNKYDAVVMNPPYGSGGKTAIEHVAKAAKHLRDGGRVVALIPRGGLADKRLETFLASEDAANLHMVADIQMPASTFERAGTAVNTHVIVLERHDNPDDAAGIQQRNIDLSGAENVGELFDSIEELGLPDRKPSSKPEPREEIVEHTTGKGKVLRGVVRTGLTKDEALEIDPFTFKKDGGYFIRAKYLGEGAKQSIDAYRGFDVDLEGAKFSVQPDGLRSLVEAEPLDLSVAPELAARPLAEVRAEGFAGMLANRGATMSNPAVGTITFNRAGITKSRSTSNDPAKVLTLANLDEIVSEAAYLGRSEPEGDGGNVVRYHYLGRRLNVDGEPMMAMITLRENADGKISYYNHSMLQDAPSIESITSESASNDNAKYQRPPLRMQRMSLADGTTATPGQSGRIRDTLTGSDLGRAVSRLLADGRVVLHDTAQSLPASSFPGTQALTMPDGTIHLVAENLTPSSAMPVLLHEMFHSGGESLVGSKRWGDLQGRLESLHRQFEKSPGKAGQFFQEARQRVQDAQRAGNRMSEALSAEEFGAYAIEQYDRAPASIRKWVDDVVGAIKEFLFRRFGIQLGQISPAQLRAMAVQALRQESVGGREAVAASVDSRVPSAAQLSDLLKQEFPGLKLDLMGAGQRVTLSRIVMPASGRNAGTGTEVMGRIIEWADQSSKTVALTPSGDFGGSKSRLISFYKRFGFVENKGANRDYEISESMYREPQSTEVRYSIKPSEHFKDLNAAQKTFLDKIGPERLPQKLKDRWSQLTDNLALRVRQAGVDRYAALLRNDQLLHGEDTLEGSIASSSWVLARMSPSAGGAVSALLNNGRIYLDTKEKVIDIKEGSEGLGATLRKLGSPQEIDRFMGWIAANRSKRLFAEGRENLFTAEEIEAGIKLSGGKLENGKSRSLLYSQAWKEFQQHRDDVLGIAEAAGIITPEQRETWSEEFYVPFYRVTDEDNVGGPSSGSGLSRQQAYKKLKGGKQHLNDLLDNTLLNFHHLIQASLKNQAAAQAMVNAKALGIASETTENKRDKKMSTFVMVDGEKQWYDVNDSLTFKAVSALADAGLNNPAMRIGRAFKRFFTNMTTITPQFVVANAIRDTLAAMATSPTSFVPLKTAFRGALTYGNDTAKARMMASGGAFSFGHVYGQNSNELKASLTQSMRGAKVLSDPKLIPGTLLGAWRRYHAVTDFAENMNRAGIWEHNLHKGKLKAGFEARDLMDFSAHGDAAIVRILTDLVPFMNARIQGLDKLYRSGAKPAVKTLFGKGTTSDKQAFGRFMAVVGTLTLMSAALYLRNKDDEDYRKLEDWQRDTYWPIKIGDSMFFIPKPFEVGSIATMGERLLEQFVDPTVGGDKLASRAAHMIGDTFAFNPIPQVVKPLYELGANENTFTGRPIEDQSMQKLSPSLRSRPETSRLADVTSRGIEAALDTVGGKNAALSPVQIDHLIQGYTGAVGATAVGMADTIWRRASGEELPARRWSEYQPIKRFYKDLTQEDNYTRYGTDFYSALKKVDQDYADFQHLVKFGQDERALELSKDKGDELALRGSLVKVSRSMSKINMEMKRVQMDKDMSGESKRVELDRLRGMRNLITEEVGKQLEEDKMVKRASGKP